VGSPGTGDGYVLNAKMPAASPPRQSAGEQPKDVDHNEVARKLKQDYNHGARDPTIRQLDSVQYLIKYLMKADPNLSEMLEQAARMVYTQFNIKEVSIALRGNSDGRYRYVAEHGMRTDIWAAHAKISYSYDELFDTKKYKAVTISHHTKLYLAEDNPYGSEEGDTYNEHMMKMSKRKSASDSIEGDYIDIFIYGPKDETYGWLEISGTWDGRIPDARSIRCMEMIAALLGIAITRHTMMEELTDPPKATDQQKKVEQAKK